MRAIALVLGLSLLTAASAANACDRHDNGSENYFLAYIDFRGMTEEQQRQAEQQAIDKYHAQQLTAAKAQFLSRFQSSFDDEEDQSTAPKPAIRSTDKTKQTTRSEQTGSEH